MSAVRFEILGPLRVTREQEELPLGPAKQQAVLATLLAAPNQVVPTARIIAAVWADEPPVNGTNVVQKYVAGLRRVLEPDRAPRSSGELLVLEPGGYRVAVGTSGSDADDFEAQVQSARALRQSGQLAEASHQFQHALSLWRGEPFEGLTGPVFDEARRHLTELRAGAIEDRAEIELELGNYLPLTHELPALAQTFPLRERLRGVQMLALHRSGRSDDALAAYRDLQERLVEEYGVEPGPDLQQLQARISSNDPSLIPGEQRAATTTQVLRRGGRDWSLGRGWPVSMTDLIPPQRPLFGRAVMKTVAVLITVVTFGFGGGVLLAVVAYLRHSRFLARVAAAYLVAWLAGAVLAITGEAERISVANYLGLFLLLLVLVASAIHVGITIAPVSVRRIRGLAALDQRNRSRQVLERDPGFARTLGIGRPHLQREYEDGGLIDPNEVPAGVLTRIPGVTAQHAALIVSSREHHGRFETLNDLTDRGLFPAPLPPAVATYLVLLPPA
ncbi:BTAD domain-containing putative transcriptional regulator [Kribbella sp. NPDC051587]|uniref:BTAD domain-containing putative transcriptional regulator n=1 Tax=Kribbella sp. NPDC051587 TaxID=3364119 RepID=UPI0037B0E9C2